MRHRNLCECAHSMNHIGVLNAEDTMIQLARCSFDVHIEEILNTMAVGATTVMLHPGGTMDFNYLSSVMQTKQITAMDNVPSFFSNFFTFIQEARNEEAVKCLRILISGGMYFIYRRKF